MHKLHLHIGKLSDASLKHRSAILLLSVLIMFIDPAVIVTFGSASLAGLGISVFPPQEVAIGLILLVLLIYRLIAFWISVLLENGTDLNRAERKALLEFDPTSDAEEDRPGDMDQLIRQESRWLVYKWKVKEIVWEFLFPNVVALFALSIYTTRYVLLKA